jgi:hypothetical protein
MSSASFQLMEKPQPDPEQAAPARMHDAQQPACVMFTVKGQRQGHGVFEELRKRREPATMGEPIRLKRHGDGGTDSAQSKPRP